MCMALHFVGELKGSGRHKEIDMILISGYQEAEISDLH